MDSVEFKKIISEIKENFKLHKAIIEEAINKDFEDGYMISFNDILEKFEIISKENNLQNIGENKIAIIYNGNLEVTFYYIINSFLSNSIIYFLGQGYDTVRTVIIELINKILEEYKIKNKIYLINEKYNIYLNSNKNSFDKIIFIGDYFEYNNIKNNIDKKVLYNPYGFLKIYIDRNKYKNEYKDLTTKAYKDNIYIEYYHDKNDFIENVNSEDTVMIYETEENKNEIIKKLNTKNILTHKNFLENYRFKEF